MGSYSRQRASTTTFSCKCSNEEQDDGSVVIASSWKELWGCLCGLIQVHSMHERGYLQVCLTWVVWASSLQDAAVLGLGFGGIPVNCLQNLMVLWVIGLIWIMQRFGHHLTCDKGTLQQTKAKRAQSHVRDNTRCFFLLFVIFFCTIEEQDDDSVVIAWSWRYCQNV